MAVVFLAVAAAWWVGGWLAGFGLIYVADVGCSFVPFSLVLLTVPCHNRKKCTSM